MLSCQALRCGRRRMPWTCRCTASPEDGEQTSSKLDTGAALSPLATSAFPCLVLRVPRDQSDRPYDVTGNRPNIEGRSRETTTETSNSEARESHRSIYPPAARHESKLSRGSDARRRRSRGHAFLSQSAPTDCAGPPRRARHDLLLLPQAIQRDAGRGWGARAHHTALPRLFARQQNVNANSSTLPYARACPCAPQGHRPAAVAMHGEAARRRRGIAHCFEERRGPN